MEILVKVMAGIAGVIGVAFTIYSANFTIKEIKEYGWELELVLLIPVLLILLGLSLLLIAISFGVDIPSDSNISEDSYNLINWMTWWIVLNNQ